MSSPIILPELTEAEAEIRVGSWFVEPGWFVEEGDRVVEVLLSGITFDVTSPVTGVLERIDLPIDAVVAPGDVLGWIGSGNGEGDGKLARTAD